MRTDVVIPCWGSYNSGLVECLFSTSEADNVVVVGDPSAVEIARAAGVEAILMGSSTRVSTARELGFRQTQGDAVCFLDADDRLLSGALSAMERALCDNPDAVAVFGFLQDSAGTLWPPRKRSLMVTFPFLGPLILWRNCFPTASACLMRRDRVTPPLFPELLDEDWHAAALLRASGRIVRLALPIARYDRSPGSLSRRTRTLPELSKSHSLLIATAARAGRRSLWTWRLFDRIAVVRRWIDDRRTASKWIGVDPR